jgi:hypothetical protein
MAVELEFNDRVTEYYLYDSCRLHTELSGREVKKFLIYKFWFALENPGLFEGLAKLLPPDTDLSNVTKDKALFYKLGSIAFDNNSDMAKLL